MDILDCFKNIVSHKSLAFSCHSVVVNNLGRLLKAGLEVSKLIVENRFRVIKGNLQKST